jgi:hypothetical protein
VLFLAAAAAVLQQRAEGGSPSTVPAMAILQRRLGWTAVTGRG